MRKDLELLSKIYDLGDVLGIKDSDVDDFIDENKEDYDCNLNKIIKLLEMGIEVKNELGDKFNSCELNNRYINYQSWEADDIGLRVYVDNVNDLDVNIIIEKDSLEVCDQDEVDETDEMFNLDEYKKACEYAINMKNPYEDDEEDEDEEDE